MMVKRRASGTSQDAASEKLTVSKQRVEDHGEVLTGDREVSAMLDLVYAEAERIKSRIPISLGEVGTAWRRQAAYSAEAVTKDTRLLNLLTVHSDERMRRAYQDREIARCADWQSRRANPSEKVSNLYPKPHQR